MRSFVFRFQSVMQVFIALGAGICGVLLILFPSGTLLGMSVEALKHSPFTDFLIPGIILFLVNGAGQVLAAVLTIRRHRLAGYAGAAFGIGLMIWIFVQVNMIGGNHILQYSYFAIGVLETAFSFLIQSYLSEAHSQASGSIGS